MKILKGSLVLFKADRLNNLYVCNANPICDKICVNSIKSDMTNLWHNRLGHMSSKGLETLHKQGCFGNDKLSCMPFCESCVYGKQHRVSFPTAPNPKVTVCSTVLEYVHADVWGPASEPTQGGNRYFLSIIDDFSRKVWVFLLKNKSDVFDSFKNWKTLTENQTGKKIKTLRTDNGLEFCNSLFDELCEQCGIKRHKTNPYTPQQNGVVERMNRTLLERVRSMLVSSGLSKKFWGECVLTAAFLINRSPSVPLDGKCPESVWSGKEIDYSHLRTFGCTAFAHKRGDKLEPRAVKCVFLGYPEGVKGYRLWVRSEPGFRTIVSRDVTFNETEFPSFFVAILKNPISH
ncbi:hypothetical protein F511_04935 [Dorcoceras hygrometricum]|uniref:Integrase catalytic domain-containing protein n=1 Tax=Dorcoceras hygrometricum TaxID=472368 RepID=A0A2Z7BK44_9LAMI|nr:hypothetical protein F511_04935 [Dorcoceras hygrometricum]